MPNFTLSAPFFVNGLTTPNTGVTLRALYLVSAPFFVNGLVSLNPGVTLLPLYHITPPFFVNGATFLDPRVFQITQPDQILKNETRHSDPLGGTIVS